MANCRPNIPAYSFPDCSFENGRVVAIGLVHKDIHAGIYADMDNASLWVDGNYAADLHIFQEVRGTYSGGQPTEAGGLGSQSSRVVNAEHTLTFRVDGIKANEDFWNEIAKSNQYRIAFVVGQNYDLLLMNNKDCSIYANLPIEEGLDSELLWNVTVKWRDIENPRTSDVPAGIFQ